MEILATMSRSMLLAIVSSIIVISAGEFDNDPLVQFHHEIIFPDDGSGGSRTSAGFGGAYDQTQSGSFEQPGLGRHAFLQPTAGNIFHRPAAFAVNLFTPNTVQQPAETPGQLENYSRALEEEAREAEKAQNSIQRSPYVGLNARTQSLPAISRSYVGIRVEGDKGYNFKYMV